MNKFLSVKTLVLTFLKDSMYMRTILSLTLILINFRKRIIHIAYHRTPLFRRIYACILPYACWKSSEMACILPRSLHLQSVERKKSGNDFFFQAALQFLKGTIHLVRTQDFPKKWHFLPPDTHQEARNVSFSKILRTH